MAELTKKELIEGKRELDGVLVLCWVMAILLGVGIFIGIGWGPWSFITGYLEAPFTMSAITSNAANFASFPFRMSYSLLLPALYIVELVGIKQRKAFAVPLGRAVLVVTMVFFFPVGTIIGGILWKRIKNPLSKSYLNYAA